MKKILIVLSVLTLLFGAQVYAYMPPAVFSWAPSDPNYNPSAIIDPGTIDTSKFMVGDFLGRSPGQPSAVGWGDSGVSFNWDDACVHYVGYPNTNGDALDGLWVHILSDGGWWDFGFKTNQVVVFLSQDHDPYLAEGLEFRVYGSNTL